MAYYVQTHPNPTQIAGLGRKLASKPKRTAHSGASLGGKVAWRGGNRRKLCTAQV
ncbi:MAG: hypothetical protein WCO04_13915 [Pseudomonadota bacterium]